MPVNSRDSWSRLAPGKGSTWQAMVSLRRMIPEDSRDRVSVQSAGFIGPGRSSPLDALKVAEERRVDLSTHESKVLTRGMAGSHGLIVVMEPGQRAAIRRQFGKQHAAILVLGDLDPEESTLRRIRDPWGRPFGAFQDSFARIDRCLVELIPYLGRRGPRR